jgi:hypothetical protein
MKKRGSKQSRYLGSISHPSVGVRLPEIFLTGILRAYKKRNVTGGLELSFGRETAPEFVIQASPGVYPIIMGHTGTSIRKYIIMSVDAAKNHGVIVEIEADHLVIGSSLRAIKRIAGIHEIIRDNSTELQESLEYNKAEIDEAFSTGYINAFTVDTSDLINYDVDGWSDAVVETQFESHFSTEEKNKLLDTYTDREFVFEGMKEHTKKYTFQSKQVMRLALKFKDSIKGNLEIYRYIVEKKGFPFGFEISLDETPEITQDEVLFFYLKEWQASGAHVDYIAPNIGFQKRRDFQGNLKELETKVAHQATIARSFGAILSIHSGSGSTPFSGKGPGTYTALLKATMGDLKYKISGVYYELLLEILESFPVQSKPKKLYNEIFDAVYDYVQEELSRGGILASDSLKNQMEKYEREINLEIIKRRTPRADFFRFNSFLALNFRDADGRRLFRRALVALYQNNDEVRNLIDDEVEALTLRLIDGLNFENNGKNLF